MAGPTLRVSALLGAGGARPSVLPPSCRCCYCPGSTFGDPCCRTWEKSQKMNGETSQARGPRGLVVVWETAYQKGSPLSRRGAHGPGCLPAGVHRSLQAPGARGAPGEAGHRSRGHREDHLGLLDKVTGRREGHKGVSGQLGLQFCVWLGWEEAQRGRSVLGWRGAGSQQASWYQSGPLALIRPGLSKCKDPPLL